MGRVKWLTHDGHGEELAEPTGLDRWYRPTPPIPRPGRRELIVDGTLALLLVLPYKPVVHYTQTLPAFSHIEPDVTKSAAFGIGFAMLVPLLLRRRLPLAGLWILLFEVQFFQYPLLNVAAAVIIAGYSAAVYSPYRRAALASLPLGFLLLFVHDYLDLVPGNNNLVAFPVAVPLIGAAAFYGAEIRRQARVDVGDQRRRRGEAQQEAIRRAVEDERSRIARELHDVVTHNVSVMVVMAGAARKVLGHSPDDATEALLEVEAAGRAAMGSCAR